MPTIPLTPTLALLLATALATAPSTKPAPPAKPADPAIESRALAYEIAQRKDPARRAAGLTRAIELLGSGEPRDAIVATGALRSVGDVKFDRAPFAEPLRRLFRSPNDEVRAAALSLLPSQGGGPRDLDLIAALAADASPRVRAAVPQAFVAANENNGGGTFDALVLRLLDDADTNVRREAIRATQNVALAEPVEARLIELSRDAKLGRDAIVLGLTTRPSVHAAVARCLLEVLDEPDPGGLYDRCAWGLRNDVAPEVRPAVDAAMLRLLDDSVDTNARVNALNAIARSTDPTTQSRIETIAADADEVDRVRDTARRILNSR